MSKNFAGKIAVATRGSTSMGLATARRFVLEVMDHVFITRRREDVLNEAVTEIGEKAAGVPGDVANLSDLDRLYEIVKVYGPKFDVIFANDGVGLEAAFANVDEVPEVRRRNTRVRFIQLLKESISREVGYGLSLEASSAANLLKSIRAATERVAPKAEVA